MYSDKCELNKFCVLTTAESRMKIIFKPPPRRLRQLSVLRQRFCCCLIIVLLLLPLSVGVLCLVFVLACVAWCLVQSSPC